LNWKEMMVLSVSVHCIWDHQGQLFIIGYRNFGLRWFHKYCVWNLFKCSKPSVEYFNHWCQRRWTSVIRKIYIHCLYVQGTSWFCTHQHVIRESQSLCSSFRPRVLVFLTYPIAYQITLISILKWLRGNQFRIKPMVQILHFQNWTQLNRCFSMSYSWKTLSSRIHHSFHLPLKLKNW
jgi:hypothetical protein